MTAILLIFHLFVLLTAYLILKTVREALILSGSGAEVKSYARCRASGPSAACCPLVWLLCQQG